MKWKKQTRYRRIYEVVQIKGSIKVVTDRVAGYTVLEGQMWLALSVHFV